MILTAFSRQWLAVGTPCLSRLLPVCFRCARITESTEHLLLDHTKKKQKICEYNWMTFVTTKFPFQCCWCWTIYSNSVWLLVPWEHFISVRLHTNIKLLHKLPRAKHLQTMNSTHRFRINVGNQTRMHSVIHCVKSAGCRERERHSAFDVWCVIIAQYDELRWAWDDRFLAAHPYNNQCNQIKMCFSS